MGKDWWPLIKSTYDYQIEWSPQGGIIRAKLRKAKKWRYARSKKARWAKSIGLMAIKKRNNNIQVL